MYLFAVFAARCEHAFFGLIPWYHYLQGNSTCDITSFNLLDPKDVSLILLAVVDDLLRLAGMLAIGYVIYGAIQYILSQGNPDATAKAQGTIVNALVGLVLAMLAVVLVTFIGNSLS